MSSTSTGVPRMMSIYTLAVVLTHFRRLMRIQHTKPPNSVPKMAAQKVMSSVTCRPSRIIL